MLYKNYVFCSNNKERLINKMKITRKNFEDFWHDEGQYMGITNNGKRYDLLANDIKECLI